MRTFNGTFFNVLQLTSNSQLDSRYLLRSGSNDVKLSNVTQSHNFYKNTSFNITESSNIFMATDSGFYTGYLPPVASGKVLAIKNIGSENPLLISGYMGSVFDQSDDTVTIFSNQGLTLLGVLNNSYTGWVNISSTQGVS